MIEAEHDFAQLSAFRNLTDLTVATKTAEQIQHVAQCALLRRLDLHFNRQGFQQLSDSEIRFAGTVEERTLRSFYCGKPWKQNCDVSPEQFIAFFSSMARLKSLYILDVSDVYRAVPFAVHVPNLSSATCTIIFLLRQ